MKLSMRLIYLMLLIVFVLVFAVGAGAAYFSPYSGRAYVEYGVAQVFSKINGNVEEIYCRNGTYVEEGEPLFRLDSRNYEAEQSRLEALYETTANRLEALDFQIREYRENIAKEQKKCEKYRIDYERDKLLWEKKAASSRSFEESQLNYEVSQRELAAMNSRLESLKRERGLPGPENSELKQLAAEMRIAHNLLDDTVIRAQVSGIISCHQLYCGQMIQTNQKYALIQQSGQMTIQADMMEKSVGRLKEGQPARVAFDAIPGRVFDARVSGVVRELRSGYVAPNEFHQIEEDSRWIRSVGRARVQFELTEPLPEGIVLTSGSKAAVGLRNPEQCFFSLITGSWVRVISCLNFVY